jgi:serine/threonine protein kinase
VAGIVSVPSQNSPRILILEPDRGVARQLLQFVVREWPGASVQSNRAALDRTGGDYEHLRSFDVVLAGCDFSEDGSTNNQSLRALRELTTDPEMPPIILLTEGGSEFSAVQSIKAGAAEYLPKSLFGSEQVTAAIRRVLAVRKPFRSGSADSAVPRLLGYDLQRCLTSNDNASVHTAFSAEQRKEVVIKILNRGHGPLSRDTRFSRFVDEFKISHDIDDPAVAEIYDFRVTPQYCYIAMEYFPLGHLATRLDGALPPAEALQLAMEVAQALSIIHMAGVVHLDLKPANIMLRDDGSVALIDFGISKSAALAGAEGTEITGTPYYMSPEQGSGEATDERADLYSLGAILYQMLVGEKPYVGSDANEILKAHREEPIPQLPDALATHQHLLSRLLVKDPDSRMASARELVEIIEHQLRAQGGDDYAMSASSA